MVKAEELVVTLLHIVYTQPVLFMFYVHLYSM